MNYNDLPTITISIPDNRLSTYFHMKSILCGLEMNLHGVYKAVYYSITVLLNDCDYRLQFCWWVVNRKITSSEIMISN
jgi:hypothetical protein